MGFIHVTCTPNALLSIRHATTALQQQQSALAPALAETLIAFMNGARIDAWPVAVALPDQFFLRRCWSELARIPYGGTITYSELAARAGNAKAIRAAASACARNPVPLVIPCHRIVAKDGTLGGFGWGLPVKRALLAMEHDTAAPRRAA